MTRECTEKFHDTNKSAKNYIWSIDFCAKRQMTAKLLLLLANKMLRVLCEKSNGHLG
jgi:hypothetical protein